MKRVNLILPLLWIVFTGYAQSSWIRVNQVGYLEDDVKVGETESIPFRIGNDVYYDITGDDSFPEIETVMRDGLLGCNPGYLSAQAKQPKKVAGGIVRSDSSKKQLSLVFTGHEYADGARKIQKVLKKNNIKGTFFLTGDFYRKYPAIARDIQKDGHYLGPHSDKHLLYADWKNRDSTLLSRTDFEKDLNDNYQTMEEIGLKVESPRYFMPPYEWYNQEISNWTEAMGVQIVNFTPGTTSNADYTTPDMKNYLSSETIYNNILAYEEKNGLNGFLLLIHIGTDPKRTDKLYDRLEDLIKKLKKRDYEFKRVDKLLKD
ncbi:polysaccharide deacetylase family protein [Proteiniphilum acetatigenes]|uniref:polysaccharide deacetylase family protein n=1 Tax=Proteiniphilum acetatigenes TaxID=294710 RepID=UPI0003A9C513|nr:polysaccharide deacetylase family protein [Proteiniphilum acetatigenes]